jgi:copper chaperone CopZ
MHCTHTIEMEVGELQGVQSVKADVNTKNVQITFDTPASEDKIKALLTEINYPVAASNRAAYHVPGVMIFLTVRHCHLKHDT